MAEISKKSTGASSHSEDTWSSINWKRVTRHVKRMQMRIAKAVREEKRGKVKALSWILTHSYYNKLDSVKRVTTNRGKKTPGVDGVIWKTPKQKMQAVKTLHRHGYHPLPLRRIYIPKKNTIKKRPLSIPIMKDRAMQALYNFALVPIAESTGDKNSYAYRLHRNSADAIAQCFTCLCWKRSAQWIFEADIEACFDNFDHTWMLTHIPTDKQVLQKWLKAGYMDKGRYHTTVKGTPQGGIISPTLANMVLDGMEEVIKKAARGLKVNLVRFADDLVITADSREILETRIIPALTAFLATRGLRLSKEKTRITHIDDGFDFLGQNIRKYKGTLLIKPSKESIKSLLAKIKDTFIASRSWTAHRLIRTLNAKVRGWAYYHRHIVSSKVFSYIDHYLFHSLWRWAIRRHPKRSKGWLIKRYWSAGKSRWHFAVLAKGTRKGKPVHRLFELIKLASIKIQRHVKIRGFANPFDARYFHYFQQRLKQRKISGKLVFAS